LRGTGERKIPKPKISPSSSLRCEENDYYFLKISDHGNHNNRQMIYHVPCRYDTIEEQT
jgi:hypothetical protein